MKLFITTLLSLFTIALPAAASAPAYAVDVFQPCQNNNATATPDICNDVSKQNNSGDNPIIDTLKKVINIISFAVGVASVIILIISGLRFVLDGDDPKVVERARSGIIYALVGIAITVLAQSLVRFVLNRF